MTLKSYNTSTQSETDPQFGSILGYRSGAVADVGAGTGTFVTEISYNGFRFPATHQSSITVVQEYDDYKRTVKFLTIALTVNAVITPVDADTATGDTTTDYQNTDEEMQYIRERLSQPGQTLVIRSKGMGNIEVNGGSSASYTDVEFGPKPQVLEIEPIAGQRAFNVTWLVTTRIIPCTGLTAKGGITQSYYSINWSTSEDGLTSRNVKGKIEIAQWRTPNLNPTMVSTNPGKATSHINYPSAINIQYANILKLFPPIGGYKRSVQYELNPAGNILNFSISDKEYPSDVPLFPTTIDMSVKENLRGTYVNKTGGDGFGVWHYEISGNFKVPKPAMSAGIPRTINDLKKETWQWFGLWLAEKLKRAKIYKYTAGESSDTEKIEKAVRHVPKAFSISDNVWGNSFNFSMSWTLYCPSSLIFLATGMFDPIDVAGVRWDEHRNRMVGYNPTKSPSNNGAGDTDPILAIPPDYVVDLCNPPIGQQVVTQSKPDPDYPFQYPFKIDFPDDPNDSFLEYKSKLKLKRISKTVWGSKIKPKEVQSEKKNANPLQNTDVNPNPADEDGPTSESETSLFFHNPSDEQYVIQVEGYGVRMGYSINPPNFERYGGVNAKKVGTDIVEEIPIAVGYDNARSTDNSSFNPAIYLVKWRKSYLLDGIPTSSETRSDGDPAIYA